MEKRLKHGRDFSACAHTVASSGGEVLEEGRMEITRSQLSQGPRGCSWRGGARTREIQLSGLSVTAATQGGRDFTWTAWDCCFPRFGNMLLSCSSTFQNQQHPLALARKRETPKWGIEEIPTTTNLTEHECCTHRDAHESCSVPVLDGDSNQELGLVVLLCASVSPLARAVPLSYGKTILVLFPVASGS